MRGASCVRRRHHSDHHTQPGCQRHCVDENLERRNHYLDLAGIENYTSRFGAGEWREARGVEKIEWRVKDWLENFEAQSTGSHYYSTCLEPLGGTTGPLCSLPVQTSGLRQTIQQVFKAVACQNTARSAILGSICGSLDVMVMVMACNYFMTDRSFCYITLCQYDLFFNRAWNRCRIMFH